MRTLAAMAVLGLLRLGSAGATPPPEWRPWKLIVVSTPSWNATAGVMRFYERDDWGGWRRTGHEVRVALGKHGLAVASLDWGGKRVKRRGDQCTPVGGFRVSGAWGTSETGPPGTRIPYAQLTKRSVCVDDLASAADGRIVDDPAPGPPSWKSAVPMRRPDGLFDLVFALRYESNGGAPIAGGCFFIHGWKDARTPTSGGIGIPPERLVELMTWVDDDTEVVVGPAWLAKKYLR